MKVVGDERDRALEEGTVDGFESSLHAYRLNGQEEAAPYVAANVNLWPQTLAVVGNRDAIAGLSEEQRGWLHQAVEDAAERSTALVDTDASSLEASCDVGARFALGSQTDLAALEGSLRSGVRGAPTRPRDAGLHRADPGDQGVHAFGSQPFHPVGLHRLGRGGSIGARRGGTGSAPAFLNGTYRWVLTQADADEVGTPKPITHT